MQSTSEAAEENQPQSMYTGKQTIKHWNRLSGEVVESPYKSLIQIMSGCGTLPYGHGGIGFHDSMKAARRAQLPCSIPGRPGKTVGWECESWVVKHRETAAAEKLHSYDGNNTLTVPHFSSLHDLVELEIAKTLT